jgi:hypothetical protein
MTSSGTWRSRRADLIGVSCERGDSDIRLAARSTGCLSGSVAIAVLVTLWAAWAAVGAAEWWRPGLIPGDKLIVLVGIALLPVATANVLWNMTYRVTLAMHGDEGKLEVKALSRRETHHFRAVAGAAAALEPPEVTADEPTPEATLHGSRCNRLTTDPPLRFGHALTHVQRAYIVRVLGEYLDARR